MSQKWSYNNLEFEVDLHDADFAERYENAFKQMEEEEKRVQKAGTTSEVIRGYCGLFFNLFDCIYGKGTSGKMFEGKVNAGMCDAAYSAFIDAARRSNQEAMQRRGQMLNKYAPHQNRQQRRHNRNGGGNK